MNSELTLLYYLKKAFVVGFDISFVFLPTIGYIHQYIKITKLKNSYGFSKTISLVLLLAFIFRIFFWIGRRFEITLLFQCIVGIMMQLALLYKCIEYSDETRDKATSDYFNLKEFWNWAYYEDYLFFIMSLTVMLGGVGNMIGYDNIAFVEFLGVISATVEAFLAVPQIYENYKVKDTKTLSYILISSWLVGDSIKFVYYIMTDVPYQMVMCAVVQFSCDLIVIGQIYYYNRKNKSHSDVIDINNN